MKKGLVSSGALVVDFVPEPGPAAAKPESARDVSWRTFEKALGSAQRQKQGGS